MDLKDLDMEFDWANVDIPPSLLNNPANVSQQVHVPNVLDSVGTKVASSNQALNTEHTSNFPEEANPQQRAFDHYELPPLPITLAPLFDETQPCCYVPSMEGLIPEGASSSVPGQDTMTSMNCYNNQFPMRHDLGGLTQQNTSNQLLLPNIESNEILNGVNQQPSSHPTLFQQNPNPGFQQQSLTSYSALNSAILGLSGARLNEGSSSQMFNTQALQIASLLRPARAPGVQLQQVPPFSVNTFTPQWANNGLAIPSYFRAQPSVTNLNMLNKNHRSTVTVQQNSSLYSQHQRGQREPPRRGRPRKHFEPAAAYAFKRGKKGWSARENVRKTFLSKANHTPHGVAEEDQNPINTSSATPSLFKNSMYDQAFEKDGVPIDPLLRLFNSYSEKPEGSATRQS